MTVSSTTSGASSSTSSTSSSTSSGSTSSISTSGTSTTSTIDWDALIQAAVDAKLTQATTIQTKITANEAKISAYQGLQTALSTLSSGLATLATSVVNSLSTSVFASRTATVSTTGDVSASAALAMAVNSGAATGTHTLTIDQIAMAQKVASAGQSSQTTELGYSGTFSLGLEGGATADITVTSGMKLQDVADAINKQTSTTNVQASIVQISSNSYELVLSGTEDAADITYSSESGDDVLNKLGVTDSSGAFSDVLQTSKAAEFTLDGIQLTRDTNDIQDVLSGVTFSLLQGTPSGASLTVDIEPDGSQISDALETFVSNYNTFRDAVLAQQTTNSDGTASSTAVLFGDGTMRDIMNQLQGILSTSVGGMTMADLGLSFNESNELQLDTGTLSTALNTNLSGVTQLLSATTTTSSSQLSVVNTGTSPQSFTLDVAVDASGNLVSASVDGDSSMFTISGNNIIGASGTIYSGMAFTYTGSTSQSITVTSTMGLAAQVYQLSKDASGTSGALETQIDSLTTVDTTLSSKVTDIQSAATTFQAQLELQYANYQAAIASADNTLTYLKALLNANSNN